MNDRTQESIEAALLSELPRSAVKERAGKGGSQALSYVDQHYIITRLNEVFGPLGWESETTRLEHVCTEKDAKDRFVVSYRSTVRLSAGSHGGDITSHEGSGFGSGIDPQEGAAHEKALKEAETDALKRAARQLGPSMGLALYDKEQNDVLEDVPGKAPAAKKTRKSSKKAAEGPKDFDVLLGILNRPASEANREEFRRLYGPARSNKTITVEENSTLAAKYKAVYPSVPQGGETTQETEAKAAQDSE